MIADLKTFSLYLYVIFSFADTQSFQTMANVLHYTITEIIVCIETNAQSPYENLPQHPKMTIRYGDISPQADLGFMLVSTQALVGWFITILVLACVISYIPRPETEDPAEK